MGPLIGVSGRQTQGHRFEGVPPVLADAPFDLHWSEYAEKVAAANGLPVQLPMAVDPVAVVERLDGLLLTGGTDITPDRYGATPGPNLWAVEPDRDAFEFALLEAAIDRDIPVLGICRGSQIINVHFGGTLVPDLPGDSGDAHPSMAYPRHIARHTITVEAGSTVSDLYGPSAVVNSFHHQSVDRVGKGLRITARSADGVVEAIEHDAHTVVGVQWHPEMMRVQEPIWDWFVKACS